MQHYLNRDGLKLAYYVDDFTKPWIKPQTTACRPGNRPPTDT